MLAIALLIQQILNFSIPTVAAPIDGWRPSFGNQTALIKHSAPAWVPEPRYRGTWGILWSCTLTLILCVYNALHLNVPAQNEGRFSYRYYVRGFKWAFVALIVPEAVLLFAGLQWYEAKRLCEELEELYEKLHPHASNPTPLAEQSHHIDSPSSEERPSLEPILLPPERHFPLEYGFYAGMGGFQIDTNRLSKSSPQLSIKGRLALTACGIIALGRAGIFIPLDYRTIRFKSQVDVITKTLTIFQVLWMVIEASVRKASGIPLSLLEIHTLVHAFCALIMYLFWFKKPVSVRDPTLAFADKVDGTILFGDGDAANRLEFGHLELPACRRRIERRHSEPSDRHRHPQPLDKPMQCRHAGSNISHFLTARPSNARDTAYEFEGLWATSLFVATFVVFAAYAAVHLTAWNFRFPTYAEEYVWRASCITILAGSLPAPMWLVLVDAVTNKSQ
ncbi:hypothetical protein BDD12DRAFT_806637 [Trichophaea hybrida]|nr:hypothetical protein BDD12DRAFT_806637 [Trichophaea hybrida]